MKNIFFLLLLTIILSSCAAPIKDLTTTQYIKSDFTGVLLQNGGLALLPIMAGQKLDGYRIPLGEYLNKSLKNAVNGGKVLTWQETMAKLNEFNKVNTYEEIISTYKQTSVLKTEKLKELYDVLHVRYVLYCNIQDISELKTTDYNRLNGWENVKTANVAAHCLVIDLLTGEIMQEVVGRATSQASDFSYNEEYDKYAHVVANSILFQLPGARVMPVVR